MLDNYLINFYKILEYYFSLFIWGKLSLFLKWIKYCNILLFVVSIIKKDIFTSVQCFVDFLFQ